MSCFKYLVFDRYLILIFAGTGGRHSPSKKVWVAAAPQNKAGALGTGSPAKERAIFDIYLY